LADPKHFGMVPPMAYTAKLPTCYGLVSDTANYLDMSRCR